MKAKINLVRGVVFLLILVLYTGNALATASFETIGEDNGLWFTWNKTTGRSVAIQYTGNYSGSDTNLVGSYFSWPG